jgi:rod shape-determining protein MreD
MKGVKGWIIAIILLWIAGACQLAIAFQISAAGMSPDFPLIVIVTVGLFSNRRTGSIVGFLGGAIHGAVEGGHIAAYTITRTAIGFLVGWFTGMEFEGNIAVAFIVTAAATICTRLTFLLLNPRGAILAFLLATIGSAVYNGVLAMPLYALLKRVLDSPRR